MFNLIKTHFSRVRLFMSGVSVLLTLLSMLVIGIQGFNLGQDFTGGVVVEATLDKHLTATQISPQLDQYLEQNVQLVKGSKDGQWNIQYQLEDGKGADSINVMLAQISSSYLITSSSMVGPQVGQEMIDQGGLAFLTCMVLTLIYLSIRFDWRLASGALVALVCDITIVLGVFSLLQLEFNLTVLAAVLAVLGYSLNDSIIIADRVRELMRIRPNGLTTHIINDAVQSTFSRTMVTSGTTLVTVSCLWLLGGASLKGFAIALFVGIVCGTWSSIALAVTTPEWLKLSPQHYIEIDYHSETDVGSPNG